MNPTLSGLFTMMAQKYIREVTADLPREEFNFILTHTGRQYRHGWPLAEDICITDIAHALSRICRFTGHVNVPLYSVAEHSVRVSYACDPQDALWGLLHDATEAYVTDMSRPLKSAPGMEVYKHYEHLTSLAVCQAFNLSPEEPESVKRADMQLCLTEMRDLFSCPEANQWAERRSREWELPMLPDRIDAWSQLYSELCFLDRFYTLMPTEPREAMRDKLYLVKGAVNDLPLQ